MKRSAPLPSLIQPTPELRAKVRVAMDRCSATADRIFTAAVRPIYGSNESGRPTHIGSSILLELDGNRYLLTAAHIIDHNSATSLYIGGAEDLVLLKATFTLTPKPGGFRGSDKYDFAIAPLSDDAVAKLGSVKYIVRAEIDDPHADDNGRLFTAIGYPNSRNNDFNNRTNHAVGHRFVYSNPSKVNKKLAANLPGGGAHHLFMKYEKHSRDNYGQPLRSIAPKGMSGCAVINAGNLADLDVILHDADPQPKLAGMVIELFPKYAILLSTRLGVVLSTLRAA